MASGRYLWTHTLQNRVFVPGDFNLRFHPNRYYHRLRKVLCGIVAITSSDIKKTFHGLVMLHLACLAGFSTSDVLRR